MMIATIIAAAAFVQPVSSHPIRMQSQPMEEIMRRITGRRCLVEATPGLVTPDRCTRRDRPVYGRGPGVSFPSNPRQAL